MVPFLSFPNYFSFLASYCFAFDDDPDGPVEFTEQTISPINLNIKISEQQLQKYFIIFPPHCCIPHLSFMCCW